MSKMKHCAHLGFLLLTSLISKSGLRSSRIRKNVLEVLIDYFNHRSKLLGQLNQVEIIDTKKEIEIYKELEGNDLNGQVLSPRRLEFQIMKVLNEDLRFKSNKIEVKKILRLF
jgi:hypothetical protein